MRILATVAVVISALGLQGPSAPPAGTPADSITREELRDHVYFLASDFLGGRRPDDPGYTIAAEYAASQFRAAGVRPAFMDAGGAPTYFQKVPMMKITTTIDSPFTLSTAAGDKGIEALDDFRLMSRGPSLTKAPMVFIGYGIAEPDHGWDDIRGLELKGKVAVMLLGAPMRNGKPVLPDAVHRTYEGIPGIGRRTALRQNRPDALIVIVDSEYVAVWDILPNVLGQPQLVYRPGGGPGRVAVPPAALAIVKGQQAEAIFDGQEYNPLLIPSQGLAGYKTFELKDKRLSLGIRATAEESGMAGSRHFLSAPPVPVADIIVNLCLDMIGRSDEKAGATRTHYVIGSGQIAPELKAIISGVNAKTVNWPLDFESMEGSINGSDSFNFHGKGIPTAFLFSGRHEDLHAPTDDAEKVDFEKVQRLSQLIYAVTAELGVRAASIKPTASPEKGPGRT